MLHLKISKFDCFFVFFLELMATGAHGSCGENALLPVEVARGHACVFVITLPLVTAVDHVREILLNYHGVTHSLAPVRPLFKRVHTSSAHKTFLKAFFDRWAAES